MFYIYFDKYHRLSSERWTSQPCVAMGMKLHTSVLSIMLRDVLYGRPHSKAIQLAVRIWPAKGLNLACGVVREC